MLEILFLINSEPRTISIFETKIGYTRDIYISLAMRIYNITWVKRHFSDLGGEMVWNSF